MNNSYFLYNLIITMFRGYACCHPAVSNRRSYLI